MTQNNEKARLLNQLELAVLARARATLPQGSSGEAENLEAVRRRVAALPVTGLPAIELPRIPAASGNSAAATGTSAAVNGNSTAAAATSQIASASHAIPMTSWFSLGSVKLAVAGMAAMGAVLIGPEWGGDERTTGDQPIGIAPREEPRPIGARALPSPAVDDPVSVRPKEAEVRSLGAPAAEPDTATQLERNSTSTPGRMLGATDSPKTVRTGLPGTSAAPALSDGSLEDRETEPVGDSHPKTMGSQQDEATASGPVASSLTIELEQLHRAQRALQAGDATGALHLMAELDAAQLEHRKTSGVLYPERQMTKVLALCALGRHAEAKVIGEALRSSTGGEVYASRLRGTCAGGPDP